MNCSQNTIYQAGRSFDLTKMPENPQDAKSWILDEVGKLFDDAIEAGATKVTDFSAMRSFDTSDMFADRMGLSLRVQGENMKSLVMTIGEVRPL